MTPYERLRNGVSTLLFSVMVPTWRRAGAGEWGLPAHMWNKHSGPGSPLPPSDDVQLFSPPCSLLICPFSFYLASCHLFPPLVNPPPTLEKKKKKIGQGNLRHLLLATSPSRFVWYLTTATVAFTNFICAEFMSDSYSVRTGERSKGGWLRVRCVYTDIMWTIHNTSADTSITILSIMLLLSSPGATIKA